LGCSGVFSEFCSDPRPVPRDRSVPGGWIDQQGPVWAALLPAGLYFCIHVLEGEIITPMLLANRFTINPVTVILSLIF
jgi:predicted PurR-regulated permease PerM